VLAILRKQEERFGRYETGSTTDILSNSFQQYGHTRLGTSPVWVRNTRDPRTHVEAILRKYGVVNCGGGSCLPSSAPRVRMIEIFRQRSFVANPKQATHAERSYISPDQPGSPSFIASLAAEERLLRRAVNTSSQASLFSETAFGGSRPSTVIGRSASPRAKMFDLRMDRPGSSMVGSPLHLGSPLRSAATSPDRKSRSTSPGPRSPASVMAGVGQKLSF